MKKTLVLGMALVLAAGGLAYAAAHGDAVNARKMAMKEVGGAMGALSRMAKGEMAFDATVALASLQKMNDVSKSFGDYFPDGSQTGADAEGKPTTAAPKIWEDMDAFKAAIAKFDADTAAAIAAAPASVEALGPLLGSVGGNCSSCHESFRVKN